MTVYSIRGLLMFLFLFLLKLDVRVLAAADLVDDSLIRGASSGVFSETPHQ